MDQKEDSPKSLAKIEQEIQSSTQDTKGKSPQEVQGLREQALSDNLERKKRNRR